MPPNPGDPGSDDLMAAVTASLAAAFPGDQHPVEIGFEWNPGGEGPIDQALLVRKAAFWVLVGIASDGEFPGVFSMRLALPPGTRSCPNWALALLQFAARSTRERPESASEGRVLRLSRPAAQGAPSTAALLLLDDPTLVIDSGAGPARRACLLLGLTRAEADLRRDWTAAKFAGEVCFRLPDLATDPLREGLEAREGFRIAVGRGMANDGSDSVTGRVADARLTRSKGQSGARLWVTPDALPHLRRMAAGRIPHDRPFTLESGDLAVLFMPGDRCSLERDGAVVTIGVTPYAARALARELPSGPGECAWEEHRHVEVCVVPVGHRVFASRPDAPAASATPVPVSSGDPSGSRPKSRTPRARHSRREQIRRSSKGGGIGVFIAVVVLSALARNGCRSMMSKPPPPRPQTYLPDLDSQITDEDLARMLNNMSPEVREILENTTRRQDAARRAEPFAHGAPIGHIALHPDGDVIATAGSDGLVKLWSASGDPLATLDTRSEVVGTVAFSPDGSRLLAQARKSPKIWIWNVADPANPVALVTLSPSQAGVSARTLELGAVEGAPWDACWAGESDRIAACRMGGDVQFWSVPAGELVGTGAETPMSARTYVSPGGRLIAELNDDCIRMLSAQDGKEVWSVEPAGGQQFGMAHTELAFSGQGNLLVGRNPGPKGTVVHAWRTADGRELWRGTLVGENPRIAVAWDGSSLVAVTRGTGVQVYLQGRVQAVPFDGTGRAPRCAAVSRDGTVLFVGDDSGTLTLFTETE